jgi:uncharacterized membrane protein
LWWFRWASIATLATGILITGAIENYYKDFFTDASASGIGHNVAISIGMVLGILMAANVWMIIWKNQKVVLANAANVLGGGEANADAPTAGRKALLASRQNMTITALLELNAVGIFGGIKAGNKMLWPYESHKNALITSGVLWLVLWILSEVLLSA